MGGYSTSYSREGKCTLSHYSHLSLHPPGSGHHRGTSSSLRSPPHLVSRMSAPASVPSLGVTNTYAQLQEQHNSKDLRSTPFSPTTYDSYGQRYATREGLVSLDSASDTVTNSASTSDGLFPTIQAPGLEFGADDYEPEFTDSGPLVEIGESVLHLGAKPHQNNTGVDPQRTHVKGPLGAKKPRRVSEGSQQRLLSQVPVDEDGKATGRRKIQIEYIQDRSRRHITFSKRKAGIMKKAYELSTLTGTQVLLLVVSEAGTVYTYTTERLEALVRETEGKDLIKECLDADEEEEPSEDAPPEPEPTRSSARTRPGTRRTASNPSLCKKASSSSLVQQESKPPPVPPLPAHCQQPCSVTSAPSIHAHTDVHFRQDYSCAQSMAIYSDANPRYTSPFNYPPTSQNYFHPHDTSHLGMLPPTSLPYSNGHVDYLQS